MSRFLNSQNVNSSKEDSFEFGVNLGRLFEKEPLVFQSPGRINLIGEHTDYNKGFVLPAAVDMQMTLVIAGRNDNQCHLYAADLRDKYKFELGNISKSEKVWPNYLLGVADQLIKAGYKIRGFDCVFGGNIPIGAGLSSSAAIEAGLASALNEIYGLGISKLDLAKFAQRSENQFVGVQCGIMDQFANIFGKENHVIKLDCRSLEFEYFPLDTTEMNIVLCDSKIKHSLASSEYNIRRKQCETGVDILKKYDGNIESLRDVTLDFLNEHRDEMDDVVYKRCAYVLRENLRVESACLNLAAGDFGSFGEKMYESHYGLKDEYEVSCEELDLLVSLASQNEGVLGSRMMGGGFGGCTINLIEKDFVESFTSSIRKNYEIKTGKQPSIYVCRITDGTGSLKNISDQEQ